MTTGLHLAVDVAAPPRAEAWTFPESFAVTCQELRMEKCAPSVITWMPAGRHFIYPIGHRGGRLLEWNVGSGIALVANRHLQAMRAKAAAGQGPVPYFDWEHEYGQSGEPIEFFWDAWGVRAFVRWSDDANDLIVRGICTSFSPDWINLGQEFLGLRANCGALLSANSKPAFGRKMPAIKPVSKLGDMKLRAKMFLRKVDALATALRKDGTEWPTFKAFETIKSERPELHEAYTLDEAIGKEFVKDFALT